MLGAVLTEGVHVSTSVRVVIALVLLAAPVAAQDHRDVVERVRRELTARGIIPAGIVNTGNNEWPCGVHEITRRVAWELRAEGWGLLEKSSGNHCEWKGQRYSMDYIVLPDGRSVDVAVSGSFDGVTTDSAPSWHIEQNDSHIGRWRPPMEPDDGPPPAPPPAPTPRPPPAIVPPPAPPLDLSHVATKEDIQKLQQTLDAVKEDTGEIRAGMNRVLKAFSKYVLPAVLAAWGAWEMKPEEEPK